MENSTWEPNRRMPPTLHLLIWRLPRIRTGSPRGAGGLGVAQSSVQSPLHSIALPFPSSRPSPDPYPLLLPPKSLTVQTSSEEAEVMKNREAAPKKEERRSTRIVGVPLADKGLRSCSLSHGSTWRRKDRERRRMDIVAEEVYRSLHHQKIELVHSRLG